MMLPFHRKAQFDSEWQAMTFVEARLKFQRATDELLEAFRFGTNEQVHKAGKYYSHAENELRRAGPAIWTISGRS
jgi:hypothetical protein